jgi:hypothetical protein
MNETKTTDQKLLEAFIVSSPDLVRLESLLAQFNIFEALGAVRQEVRHSDFLAFLLDPNQSHGLGDAFLKRLLQRALSTTDQSAVSVTPVDVDCWDLSELQVQREWSNIDILLTDEPSKLVVVIENKILSGEHSDQLARYRRTVQEKFPGRNFLCLFLSPDGDPPSDPSYLPVGYDTVCEIIEELAASRVATLGADVRTLMTNYTQMLRRHIVSESEIAQLCRRIYQKHKAAIDLIVEHRPDRHAEIREFLEGIIKATAGVVPDQSSKAYIRFCPAEWDQYAELKEGQGWTKSRRMLMFEFENYEDYLKLKLVIGPGPQATRQRLFDFAQKDGALLKPAFKALPSTWCTIYVRSFFRGKDLQDADGETIKKHIEKHWSEFVASDLPKITAAICPVFKA